MTPAVRRSVVSSADRTNIDVSAVEGGVTKKPRPVDPGQLGLFAEEEPVTPAPPPVDSKSMLISDIKEQIIRDEQTLRMDVEFVVPSREFYVERAASFRAWLREVDNGAC